VTQPFPEYLKLHVEDDGLPPLVVEPPGPVLERVFRGLESATGWLFSLEPKGPGRADPAVRNLVTRDGQLRLKQTANPPRCSADEIYDLGTALAQLADQWQGIGTLLKRYEAELAATVPVVVNVNDSRHLATRLESVLKGLVDGLGANAASVYLLDEATSELKLRAQWGLPEQCWTDPPRPLRGSVADLEALTGHAVVIEETRLLPHWRIPEDYPAAVCVPVSTPTVPLGTLWLFHSQPRDFTSQETNLIEIVAGRIATELERESLVRDVQLLRGGPATFMRSAAANSQRPPQRLEWPGWEVAASAGWPDRSPADWIDWRLAGTHQLNFSLGSACHAMGYYGGGSGEARGALWTALQQPLDPGGALELVSQMLWQLSKGDLAAHLVVGQVDGRSGTLQLATAGQAEAYILRPHGWEPTHELSEPAGADPDSMYTTSRYRLEAGDILCVICQPASDPTSEYGPEIAELLLHNTHLTAQQLTELYDRQFASKWPILIVKRLAGIEPTLGSL
jgi:GAF domain-containing protein